MVLYVLGTLVPLFARHFMIRTVTLAVLFCTSLACESRHFESKNNESGPSNVETSIPNPTTPQSKTPISDETLTYCEIANNPEKYNGKLVRFNGNLYWFMHGFYIHDEKCSDEFPKKPTQPNWNYYDRRAGVSFDESSREALWDRLMNKNPLKRSHESHWRIVATGKFSFRVPCANDSFCSDHILDRVYFEFQINDFHSIRVVND